MFWGKARGNITARVIGNNLCYKRHSGLKPTSTRFRQAYLRPKEGLTAVGCSKSYILTCLHGTAGGLVQEWALQVTTVNVRGRISPKKLGNLMEVEGCIVHRWRRGMNMLWARGPAKPRFALQPLPMNLGFQRSLRHVIRLRVVLGWVSSHKAIAQAAASAAELWEGVRFQVITLTVLLANSAQLDRWRWHTKSSSPTWSNPCRGSTCRVMPCGPNARPNAFKCFAAPSYLRLPAVGCAESNCGWWVGEDSADGTLLFLPAPPRLTRFPPGSCQMHQESTETISKRISFEVPNANIEQNMA